MARFLRHIACPNCGSRDNRGLYDDNGEFCFGCGDKKRGTLSPLVAASRHGNDSNCSVRTLPDDASTHFGPDALTWLGNYHVPIEILLARGVRYSPSRNQLLFTFPPSEFFQARNLSKSDWRGKKLSKYFTSGPHEDLLPIYTKGDECGRCEALVLTEDCLSAITIASARLFGTAASDAMPLLGTHLPTAKLTRLNRLYRNLVVWLDHDKGKEAMSIAKRAQLLGMRARVVITEKDPKELSDSDITYLLTECKSA